MSELAVVTGYIVKDDQGEMHRNKACNFESVIEAYIDALDTLKSWFEDEGEDVYDEAFCEECADEIDDYIDNVKAGLYDETEMFDIAGFEVTPY